MTAGIMDLPANKRGTSTEEGTENVTERIFG